MAWVNERGEFSPEAFRAALFDVPPPQRDTWVDAVFGIEEVADDGPELPPGGVPYIPCSVDAVLRAIDQASVCASDVFVDVGSGAGRTAALVHLLTGAGVVGIEIQPKLAREARDLAARLRLSRVSFVLGDAAKITGFMMIGSVFFLNCPFGGERLAQVLADLEVVARTRPIRICCVDLPLPHREWLRSHPGPTGAGGLEIFTSCPPISPLLESS